MKKTAVLLTAYHKIPKLSPGGPGYMIELIGLGFLQLKLDWDIAVIGLEKHPSAQRGPFSAIKSYLKLHAPRRLRACLAYWRLKTWSRQYARILLKHTELLDRAEIIHVHDPVAFDALTRLKRWNHKKIIYTDHSPGSLFQLITRYVPQRPYRSCERKIIELELSASRESNAISLISNGQQRLKCQEIPELEPLLGRAQVIYNGLADYPTGAIPIIAGLPAVPIIGFVGGLTREKGIDLLLESFVQYATAHPNDQAILEVVGDGPLRSKLERRYRHWVRKKRVVFYGQRSDVAILLPRFSLFVSPGRRSGFDLAILEALRAGCAVIVSDTGGNREAVGSAGLILKSLDSEALSAALDKLLNDQDLRTSLKEKARTRFQKYFSLATMSRQYQLLYNQTKHRE